MTLPKHLRPRWRYLALEIRMWPDAAINREQLQLGIQRSSRRLVGDVGAARLDPRVLRYEQAPGLATSVVRIRREGVEDARAALACMTTLAGHPVGIRVRGVSGTVRGCEEKYLGSQPEPLTENTVVFEGAERPAVRCGEDIDIQVGEAFVGATRLDLE